MYQPVTIRFEGSYSKRNNPATSSGSIACIAGEAWVRLLGTATVQASGSNPALVDPDAGAFTDGWLHLTAGVTVPFGQERINGPSLGAVTVLDLVAQIDVYAIDGDTEILIQQH